MRQLSLLLLLLLLLSKLSLLVSSRVEFRSGTGVYEDTFMEFSSEVERNHENQSGQLASFLDYICNVHMRTYTFTFRTGVRMTTMALPSING
jgi:hypothetical protein